MKFYSIGKCRKVLRYGHRLFTQKGDRLTEQDRKAFEADLRLLDEALLSGKKEEAVTYAKQVESFAKKHFPKTSFDHAKEIFFALAFAIVVAFCIRQFWFELYEVPTGSMRPTVEELDRLVVSKTTFGINFPFRKKPLLFSPDYIQRAGIIVFTVAGMDIPDADMLYFGFIPGKKRYIKRCVAKPGDTVYFYGGQIYGIDKEGKPLLELADDNFLKANGIERIDHIPFITFDGKISVSQRVAQNLYGAATINQMNLPVGKLQLDGKNVGEGQFFNGKEWVTDHPEALKAPRDAPVSYSDLWGIGNYAMARLLTKEDVKLFYQETPKEDAMLFLELRHTPNLAYPKPEIRRDDQGRYHPMITPYAALLPLKRSHLEALQKSLYTARFVVKNGHAYRYHENNTRPQRLEFDIDLPQVPNGTYEFYYGVGYQIHFGGIRTKLASNHPLYDFSAEMIKTLFNQGMSFNILFEPMAANQTFNPQRFAYYRDGDLFVMGAPLLKKNDPVLINFVQNELDKQERSSRDAPYIAFTDNGPPMKNGALDQDFIRAFGLHVPETGLIALGDNYAMSADSRDFGFVPLENLRGAPSFTFWPPGPRLGSLPQPPYPWFTLPNCLVWLAVLIIAILTWRYIRKRNSQSIFERKK